MHLKCEVNYSRSCLVAAVGRGSGRCGGGGSVGVISGSGGSDGGRSGSKRGEDGCIGS